jgi:general stress protein 26
MDDTRKLSSLIKGIPFAMLTTVGQNGHLHTRPMATQARDFDGDLWFFTDGSAPKVSELYHNRELSVAYVDADSHKYVAVSGTGEIVRDRSKIKELWSTTLNAWFPDGPGSENIALIRVDVQSAEYWVGQSAPVRLLGFAKAILTGERYQGGENEKLDLKSTG